MLGFVLVFGLCKLKEQLLHVKNNSKCRDTQRHTFCNNFNVHSRGGDYFKYLSVLKWGGGCSRRQERFFAL